MLKIDSKCFSLFSRHRPDVLCKKSYAKLCQTFGPDEADNKKAREQAARRLSPSLAAVAEIATELDLEQSRSQWPPSHLVALPDCSTLFPLSFTPRECYPLYFSLATRYGTSTYHPGRTCPLCALCLLVRDHCRRSWARCSYTDPCHLAC